MYIYQSSSLSPPFKTLLPNDLGHKLRLMWNHSSILSRTGYFPMSTKFASLIYGSTSSIFVMPNFQLILYNLLMSISFPTNQMRLTSFLFFIQHGLMRLKGSPLAQIADDFSSILGILLLRSVSNNLFQ